MKMERLIGILSILLQRERITAPELAEQFEVSRRTIQRDIESLCRAGIPIATAQGAGGGISIMEGYRVDRTVLTAPEMQAILAGLRSLDSVSGTRRYAQLMEKLSSLVKTIFTAERMLVSATCEESEIPAVTQASAALKNVLYVPDQPGKNRSMPSYPLAKKNEGFMDASQVQYVARAGNYAAHGFSYHGALRILKVILGYDYLWINVRVKGGAYGCMNGYMRNGDTYFVSYRDPNLSATNEIYDGIPAYLEKFDADEREMTGYIIGTISDMDTPMNPSAKGARSMTAYLQELDYETLSKERSQIIGAQPADIRALKPLIASVLSDGSLCVIGNEDVLTSEKQMFEALESLT